MSFCFPVLSNDSLVATLRDDSDIVMEAVSKDGSALQYASLRLRGDRELVMKAVSLGGMALMHASDDLRGDYEIVMQAVAGPAGNGLALQWAAVPLRASREIVIQAVQNHGWAFEFASEELRGDRTVIDLALTNSCTGTHSLGHNTAVILKVMLLSGRCCHQIFNPEYEDLKDVKLQCADLLGLCSDRVLEHGTLMLGPEVVHSMSQLAGSQVHELTLVLS